MARLAILCHDLLWVGETENDVEVCGVVIEERWELTGGTNGFPGFYPLR